MGPVVAVDRSRMEAVAMIATPQTGTPPWIQTISGPRAKPDTLFVGCSVPVAIGCTTWSRANAANRKERPAHTMDATTRMWEFPSTTSVGASVKLATASLDSTAVPATTYTALRSSDAAR